MTKNKHLAFTLIEILIVVAIIAVLAVVIMVSYSKAKAKSRDSRRITDINDVNLALKMLYEKDKQILYGACENSTWTIHSDAMKMMLVPNYIDFLPHDPNYQESDLLYDHQYLYVTVASSGGLTEGGDCDRPYTLASGYLPAQKYYFSAKMEINDPKYINVSSIPGAATAFDHSENNMSPGMRYVVVGP